MSTPNDGSPLQQGVTILRTNLSNGTRIDTIVIDENEMYNLIEGVNPNDPDAANRKVSITHVDDSAAQADEIAVEIPSGAVSVLAGRKASLDIVTALGSIRLDAASLEQLEATTTDLYFRVVPVENTLEQLRVQSNAVLNGVSKLALTSDKTLQTLELQGRLKPTTARSTPRFCFRSLKSLAAFRCKAPGRVMPSWTACGYMLNTATARLPSILQRLCIIPAASL